MTEDRVPDRPRPRRVLLELAGAAAVGAVILAAACMPGTMQGAPRAAPEAVGGPVSADTPRARLRPPAARDYADSLREPTMVRSVGGVLTATLEVDTATLLVPDSVGGQRLNLRAFRLAGTTDPRFQLNDPRFRSAFPGPTFRVQRGDLVRILLVNELPQLGPQDSNEACDQPTATGLAGYVPDIFQSCFHGPNLTNIHYHGMHVTPDSTSTAVGDDVLMAIAPGDNLQYSFRIPQNQSPGTHWYHPHKHGSVALQVTNGMAGAFIVEDTTAGLDSIVKQHGMIEHLVAVQQVAETLGLFGGAGLDSRSPLVNGQHQPTVYMAPGEVQRWRIVNENTTKTSKTFDIGFNDGPGDEPSLFDVARDGVQFAPGNYDPRHPDVSLHMAPGQRLDVFVRAPLAEGTHLFQVAHNGGAGRGSRDPTLPPDTDLVNTNASPEADAAPVMVLKVVVDSALAGRNTYLPTSLPPQLPFLSGQLPAASDTAHVVFTDSLFRFPTQFYLGSRLNPFQRFNDNTVFVPSNAVGAPMPMVLGQTQTWKVINDSENGINHPFHIHINPFQVNRIEYPLGKNDPFHVLYEQLNAAAVRGTPIWLDVLPLPLPATDTIRNKQDTTKIDSLVRREAYAVITQKYDAFEGCRDENCGPPVGYFVMHCHILGHEERGMMQVLQVVAPGEPVSPPEGHVGPGHSHGASQPRGPGSGQGRGSGQGGGRGRGGQGQPPAPPHRH